MKREIRIAAFVLAMVLLMGLAACGKKASSAEDAISQHDEAIKDDTGSGLEGMLDTVNEAGQQAAETEIAVEDPVPIGEEDGLSWTEEDGKAVVTGYTGEKMAIILPDTLGGCPVFAIGDSAFQSTGVSVVVLPASVEEIRDGAFYFCRALVKVSMPGVRTIGREAFEGCLLLRDFTLPETLETIGKMAFGNCSSLRSVVIPQGVTELGDSVFYDCSSLASIVAAENNNVYHSAGNCLIETGSKKLLFGQSVHLYFFLSQTPCNHSLAHAGT